MKKIDQHVDFRFSLKASLLSLLAMIFVLTTGFGQDKKLTGYAPVNGLKIYYEVHGEGAPIVLLHGAYMTIDLNWSQLIPELSKKRKVIALELQGHGRTADIQRPYSYQSLASDVAGVLKHLKVDSADVFGYSFGGTVALQLAIQNPALVRKLVIASTAYRYDGWLPAVRDVLKTIKPEFFEATPLKTEYVRLAPDTANWARFINKMAKFDQQDYNLGEDKMKSIKSPVLFIMGDNDGVSLEHKTKMYRLCGGDVFGDMAGLPKSQLAILPASTHVGLMMETDKLLSFIIPFLDNQPKPNPMQH